MKTKTVMITICGRPNVGKSTLTNYLVGEKIAIVSNKPQTTRNRICGIVTREDTQYVFVDTPGFHRPHNKLGEKMIKAVTESIGGVDACMFVTEPEGELREEEKELLSKCRAQKMPVVLVINKIDTVSQKTDLMKRIAYLSAQYDFEAVVPVSALKNDGMDALTDELTALAFPSEHFFPDDTLTDQPERVIAGEIIREKMLRLLDREIPHGVAVSIEKMRERPDKDIMDVEAVIYCEKESHKGIIIGKGGSMLKRISTYARQDMERFFDCKINLKCWVKAKEGWRNREGLIHNFGLD